MGLFDFMQEAIAIDLGTANTLIIHNDKVVVDEPSIVAKNVRTGEVIAIGKKAQQMHLLEKIPKNRQIPSAPKPAGRAGSWHPGAAIAIIALWRRPKHSAMTALMRSRLSRQTIFMRRWPWPLWSRALISSAKNL